MLTKDDRTWRVLVYAMTAIEEGFCMNCSASFLDVLYNNVVALWYTYTGVSSSDY